MEESLVGSDVGIHTTLELIERLQDKVKSESITEPDQVRPRMRSVITELFERKSDSIAFPTGERVVLLVVGVNGSGKTTSIAKLAKSAKADGRKVMLAAADTFRAGAIEQINIWGDRLEIPVISQQMGGDPGAVTYDALNAAKARDIDLLIIDTAGRLHTTHNLMQEIRKVRGIVNNNASGFIERTLLVIDGTTGQNGLLQAKSFSDAVNCDGVFLTKLDGTARGGVALAVASEANLPIRFIGAGEGIRDLRPFNSFEFIEALLASR